MNSHLLRRGLACRLTWSLQTCICKIVLEGTLSGIQCRDWNLQSDCCQLRPRALPWGTWLALKRHLPGCQPVPKAVSPQLMAEPMDT